MKFSRNHLFGPDDVYKYIESMLIERYKHPICDNDVIRFKELHQKLVKHGCLPEFLINTMCDVYVANTFSVDFNICDHAFSISHSPQGSDFWYDIFWR